MRSVQNRDVLIPHLIINTMREHKAEILDSIFNLFSSKRDEKPFYNFITSYEGQRRIRVLYEIILKALQGDTKAFIEDQSRIGYLRAMQGFPLDDLFEASRLIGDIILNRFLSKYYDYDLSKKDIYDELLCFFVMADKARETLAKSYLKTKEEIVRKRSEQIQGLYKLRIALDDNLSTTDFCKLVIKEIPGIFGTPHVIITIYDQSKKNTLPLLQIGSSKIATDLFNSGKMGERFRNMMHIRVPHFIAHFGKNFHSIDPDGIHAVPAGYWLTIPIFTGHSFYGFLCINTNIVRKQFISSDAYVLITVVSKIAQVMEKNRTLKILKKNQSELKSLANRIINAQEEERKRISAEIHDTIIQRFSAIWYKLEYLKRTTPNFKNSAGQLNMLENYIIESIEEARHIVSGLRPLMLEELGFQKTMEDHIKTFQSRNSIDVDFVFKGDCSHVSYENQISIFRIFQEAMENVKKHSDAKHARVAIRFDDKGCFFKVEDFGTGKSTGAMNRRELPSNHFGLMIMKERAEAMNGNLKFFYRNGGGFVVKGEIPFVKSLSRRRKFDPSLSSR